MKQIYSVYGVDPGLVHTGVVMMNFNSQLRRIIIGATAIAGADASAVQQAIGNADERHGFIEAYRPRSNFNSDARMVKAVDDLKKALPKAKVLQNTGVTKIVKKPLMGLLGVWQFNQVTHHQDLRSAARIALLGMMKDPELNTLLANIVLANQSGRAWRVLN